MKARAFYRKHEGADLVMEFSTDSEHTALATALTIMGRKELHKDDFLEIHLQEASGSTKVMSFGKEKEEVRSLTVAIKPAPAAQAQRILPFEEKKTATVASTSRSWTSGLVCAPIAHLGKRVFVSRSKANA